MRPRTEALLAVAVFGTAIAVVAALGLRRTPAVDQDVRRSTLLSGPNGARGLADALERVGVRVTRLRDRQSVLGVAHGNGADRAVLLLISPVRSLSPLELTSAVNVTVAQDGMSLVAASVNGLSLAACLGYQTAFSVADSHRVRTPAGERWLRPAWVRSYFERLPSDSGADSSKAAFGVFDPCGAIPDLHADAMIAHDTLLVDEADHPVMIRMRGGPLSHDLVLVSDPALFANTIVRRTDAGPFLLGFLAASYTRVLVDEYHQGFGASGSLGSATLAWSASSPWGWLVWQVALAGLLALLASAVRFGPVRALPARPRRSPHEHVHALATALAAAHGHQVAVGRLVQGLRRRLSPGTAATRVRWRPWLQAFARQATKPDTRAAAERLLSLANDAAEPERVLHVAQAVEDVWTTMRR